MLWSILRGRGIDVGKEGRRRGQSLVLFLVSKSFTRACRHSFKGQSSALPSKVHSPLPREERLEREVGGWHGIKGKEKREGGRGEEGGRRPFSF